MSKTYIIHRSDTTQPTVLKDVFHHQVEHVQFVNEHGGGGEARIVFYDSSMEIIDTIAVHDFFKAEVIDGDEPIQIKESLMAYLTRIKGE